MSTLADFRPCHLFSHTEWLDANWTCKLIIIEPTQPFLSKCNINTTTGIITSCRLRTIVGYFTASFKITLGTQQLRLVTCWSIRHCSIYLQNFRSRLCRVNLFHVLFLGNAPNKETRSTTVILGTRDLCDGVMEIPRLTMSKDSLRWMMKWMDKKMKTTTHACQKMSRRLRASYHSPS